jgi:hypothetical protein
MLPVEVPEVVPLPEVAPLVVLLVPEVLPGLPVWSCANAGAAHNSTDAAKQRTPLETRVLAIRILLRTVLNQQLSSNLDAPRILQARAHPRAAITHVRLGVPGGLLVVQKRGFAQARISGFLRLSKRWKRLARRFRSSG